MTDLGHGRTEHENDREALVEGGLLKVQEVGCFLGLSRAAVYQLMERGELAWVQLGRTRRVPRRAVVRLAASRLTGGGHDGA